MTFHVVAQDDESRVVVVNQSYGNGGSLAKTDGVPFNALGYGPWDAPALAPSTFDSSEFTNTYSRAGTYHVTFRVSTRGWNFGDDCPGDVSKPQNPDGSYPCVDPFTEYLVASIDITVS